MYDVSLLRTLVLVFGALCAFCAAGIVVLTALGYDAPQSLSTGLATLIGALGTLFVNPAVRESQSGGEPTDPTRSGSHP